MKKKKWIIFVVILIILLLVGVFSFFFYQNMVQEKERLEREKKEKTEHARILDIKNHYHEKVSVIKTCNIYRKGTNDYEKIGRIEKGEVLTLEKIDDFHDPYFKVQDRDFYIPYSCVLETSNEKVIDIRYQNYVPFPEKIKTKDKVTLYRGDKKVYELFYSTSSQVIKKEEDSYFIEYFGELFKVLKSDVLEVEETQDTVSFAQSIPVTAYHFIYPEGDYGCSGIICHPVSQIRSHFAYLKENHFFTITTSEMEEFLDEKIRLPEKSILITIDDGDRAENVIPLLEEFELNATLFLITAWYSPSNYQSPYLELASHTHELHEPGRCAGGQGSALKCLEKDKIVEDLKISRSVLNGTRAFCYPLYEYNDHAIDAVSTAGFSLGFIGGQKRAKLSSSKLLIPRITIFRDTTLEEYIEIVS